nr:hypothetical transcript [Hymenolepis microstoma]
MHHGQRILIRQKKLTKRQSTSNYPDPAAVCHIPPLPQCSPYLTFFSTFVSLSLSYICESLFCSSSRLVDFDVPPLCEARSQLKGK